MPADKIDSKLQHKLETHSQLLDVPVVRMVKDKPLQVDSEESKLSNNSGITDQHDDDRQKLFLYLTILKSVVCLTVILFMMRFVGYNSPRARLMRPKEKTILLWNAERDKVTWEYMHCGCVLTNNRDYTGDPIHAIVFNADRDFTLDGLDRINRTPHFLAVFAARNPLSLARNPLLERGESVFNFTMTYRHDSNILWTEYYFTEIDQKHQGLTDLDTNLLETTSNEILSQLQWKLKKKNRFMFYMVYEVNEYSLPESLYLQKLRYYLDLDAFITCHGFQDCGQYKFMLIFEPSECPDFVHPQIYKALAHFVVPVIIGRRNMSGLIPPGSYINSADFETPEMLAMHLEKLSNEPLLYERLFDWHSKYRIHKNRHPYCALCRQLRDQRQRIPPDEFHNWWTGYQCPNRKNVDLTKNEISAQFRNDFNYQSHWIR